MREVRIRRVQRRASNHTYQCTGSILHLVVGRFLNGVQVLGLPDQVPHGLDEVFDVDVVHGLEAANGALVSLASCSVLLSWCMRVSVWGAAQDLSPRGLENSNPPVDEAVDELDAVLEDCWEAGTKSGWLADESDWKRSWLAIQI